MSKNTPLKTCIYQINVVPLHPLKLRSWIVSKCRMFFQLSTLNFQLYNGAIAQLVEQRTENPCVPGSIPGGTTREN